MSWWWTVLIVCLVIIIVFEMPIYECSGLPPFTLQNNILNGPIKHYYSSHPLPLDICLENIEAWRTIADKYGIRWWCSEGTALGLFRANELNVNDDDVDICMDGEWLSWFCVHGMQEMKRQGFRHVHTNAGYMISFIRRQVKLDVAFQVRGPGLLCIAGDQECDNTYPYTRNLRWIQGKYPVPDHVEYYETLYGPTWQTPQRHLKPLCQVDTRNTCPSEST